jgi:hypothetical protein
MTKWIWILGTMVLAVPAFAQKDNFVLLDAAHENVACVAESSQTSCLDNSKHLFLRQGYRAEMRVLNRRFLTDYTLTIDGVTRVLSGVQVRNLEEAANLTVPVAPPVAPVAKGGAEVIRSRSAADILNALIDETTASQTIADLDADAREIERERTRIAAELRSFKESYQLVRGIPGKIYPRGSIAGAPNIESLHAALQQEYTVLTSGIWGQAPFCNEDEFRNVNTRVQDLLTAVKLLGTTLTASNLPQAAQAIYADVPQYEKNVGTLSANIEAARDAVRLLDDMININAKADSNSLRTELRKAQIKALLTTKLKAAPADQKPVLDDAEINMLLAEYEVFLHSADTHVAGKRSAWLGDAADIYGKQLPDFKEFRADLDRVRSKINIDLPKAVNEVNAAQGRLLTRVNFIYDHSSVEVPLIKQIDLSGHSGNLIVYFTIRRVETFPRYTVPQIQGPGGGSPASPAAGTPLPAQGASGNATPQTPSPPATPPAAAAAPTGIVVAQGQFEVHDFYHATVVGFFGFGYFKEQSFAKQAASTTNGTVPSGCTGTPPDTNCFVPVATNSSFHSDMVFGPLYYLSPTDTYPGVPRTMRQKTGIFGGVSATRLNHYYAGIGYEPKIGTQILAGVHVGTTPGLQQPYSEGAAADITGDFPTHDIHRVGFFLGVGFDLNIFRKIFGSVTGVGTKTSSTEGK